MISISVCCPQDEPKRFVQELLEDLTSTIRDLQPHQVNSFFESVGLMISAETDERLQVQYLVSVHHSNRHYGLCSKADIVVCNQIRQVYCS